VDVEVAMRLEAPPLALGVVQQEAVLDDEEPAHSSRKRDLHHRHQVLDRN